MDGFKNTTRTQYSMGGYAKGGSKFGKVMGEFKAGTLHSGSKKGPEVSNPKQAIAIALSEARKTGAKVPMKKDEGGMVETRDEMNRRTVETPSRALTSEEVKALRKTTLPKKAVPPVNRTPLIQPKKMSDLDRRTMEEPSAPYKKGGSVDAKQDKALVKKAVHKHEAAMHPGKPMTKLRKGGMAC